MLNRSKINPFTAPVIFVIPGEGNLAIDDVFVCPQDPMDVSLFNTTNGVGRVSEILEVSEGCYKKIAERRYIARNALTECNVRPNDGNSALIAATCSTWWPVALSSLRRRSRLATSARG